MVFTGGIRRVRPGPRDLRRNPVVCVVITVALAATFWMGLIWLAERITG
jgi:hypothetical protein